MTIELPPLHFHFDVSDPAVLQVDPQHGLHMLRLVALAAAEHAKGVWILVSQRMKIRATGAYIRGIEGAAVVVEKAGAIAPGTTSWEMVVSITNNAPHARLVEEGHAAFHLPSVIDWGKTSGSIKRSKKGTPYLHIPFQHRAFARAATDEELARPGGPPTNTREGAGLTGSTIRKMMPEHVYKSAKRLHYVTPKRVGPIRHGGQLVARDRYNWPKGRHGRLDRGNTRPQIQLGTGDTGDRGQHNIGWEEHRSARVAGRDRDGNAMVNPAWKSSKFHGMFKGGKKGHTQYTTIRVVTPTSPGWNIPAQEGRHVLRRVTSYLSGERGQARMLAAALAVAVDPTGEGK